MNGEANDLLKTTQEELDFLRECVNRDKTNREVKFFISYGVIKATGCIERSFKSILYNVLSAEASQETKYFLEKKIIDSSTNPSVGAISRILQDINSDWNSEFNKFIKDENDKELKSHMNSLVQLRNDFAHGRNITCSIETVIKYFESSHTVINKMYEIVSNRE